MRKDEHKIIGKCCLIFLGLNRFGIGLYRIVYGWIGLYMV